MNAVPEKAGPKRAALRVVERAANQAERARQALEGKLGDRDLAMLKAQADGATYPELAAASGLSQARVKQVLTETRNNNPTRITE